MNNYVIIKNYNDYTYTEKLFLQKWVNNTDGFCEVIRESYLDNPNKQLEEMFSKYDSEYLKTTYVYRGVNFIKNNELSKEIYQELCTSFYEAYEYENQVYIDYAPSSFSFSSLIADKFAKSHSQKYFSIIFKIELRILNEINVFSYVHPLCENEEEIILQTNNAIFDILQLNQFPDILEVVLKERKWQ